MTEDELVEVVARAQSWDARIAAIRLVPERFGTASHQRVYAAIAKRFYVPSLAPDYAYVHWRDEYEIEALTSAYEQASAATHGFTQVSVQAIEDTILSHPRALRIFRLILGFTPQEFASSASLVAEHGSKKALSVSRVKSAEDGAVPSRAVAGLCAEIVSRALRKELFGVSPSLDVRLKTDKPDTIDGWASVQHFAENGVPFPVFLHQRHYGGAFRQLLDATSSKRGDILEDAVEERLRVAEVPFIRTGSHNQEEIARRFSVTVKPAPDFVVFDKTDSLRAIIECKGANDGGTARDKAARFRALRAEGERLGGIPLFAVLAGLGWTRTADALGPVVRATDGRAFTAPTLADMLTVQPFPSLARTQF